MMTDRHCLMAKKHAQVFLKSLGVKNLEDFHPHTQDWNELAKAKREATKAVREVLDNITPDNEKRNLEYEAAADAILDLQANIIEEMDFRSNLGDRGPRKFAETVDISKRPMLVTEQDEPDSISLRSDQTLKAWAEPRIGEDYRGLTLGKYLRAMVMGASNDLEHRALSEGTDSAGGYTVPTVLAAGMIDALRAESVINAAGARTIPLTSDNISIAKVASDPTPAFRAEAAAITESDPSFTTVNMTPRSMALMTKVSRELWEDSVNLESELPRILAVAMAKEMDRICLLGSGTAPEPRGVLNQSGIGTTAHNAAISSYSPLLVAQTDILSNNAGPVTAIIMHPRDAGDFAALVDTTNQPLNMPQALSGIRMLTTTAIPTDEGSGSNESTIFVGNFNHLLIGVRAGVRVDILRERYAENYQYGLVAHMRFDVAVQHAAAFHAITGVQS
ncbi:MAG: phage major capsid protein [Alphaproteobacteria bacterium]